ncbi:MAG: hypothetical protein PHH70_04060 [Candidatus Gracilibacteria bacterium]|nr:hypothetical protein [Candidatus Gracilibacteria bacterium]
MKEQFQNLITNTTSLVGYIAVLMFIGAYIGGDQSCMSDPLSIKGNILENKNSSPSVMTKSVILTIDGRQYEAIIQTKNQESMKLTY